MSAAKQRYAPGSFVVATRDDGTTVNGFIERCVDISTPVHLAVSPRARRSINDRFLIRPLRIHHMPYTAFGANAAQSGNCLSDNDPTSPKAMVQMAPAEVFPLKALKPLLPPGFQLAAAHEKEDEESSSSSSIGSDDDDDKAIGIDDDDASKMKKNTNNGAKKKAATSNKNNSSANKKTKPAAKAGATSTTSKRQTKTAARGDDDDDDAPTGCARGGEARLPFSGTALEQACFRALYPILQEDGRFDKCMTCGIGGELMMCESCVCVSHLGCSGLRQLPTSEWRCAVCNGQQKPIAAATAFREEIITLVEELQEHDVHDIFALPPPLTHTLPDYGLRVEHPVDLSMVSRKAANSCYLSLSELWEDVNWMVNNCMSFNQFTDFVTYSESFNERAATLFQKSREHLRNTGVPESFPPQLMALSACFVSVEQARAIDPVSVSLPPFQLLGVGAVENNNNNNHVRGGGRGGKVRNAKKRGAAHASNAIFLLNRGLPKHVRNIHDAKPPEPLIFPSTRRLAKEHPDKLGPSLANHVFFFPLRVTLVAPPSYKYSNVQTPAMIYTTDGTNPASSPTARAYDRRPLLLSATADLRAIAVESLGRFGDDDKKAWSATATQKFTFASAEETERVRNEWLQRSERLMRQEQARRGPNMNNNNNNDSNSNGSSSSQHAEDDGQLEGSSGDDDDLLRNHSANSTPLLLPVSAPTSAAAQQQQQQLVGTTTKASTTASSASSTTTDRRRQRVVSFDEHVTELVRVPPPPPPPAPAVSAASSSLSLAIVQQPGNPMLQQLSYHHRLPSVSKPKRTTIPSSRGGKQQQQSQHEQSLMQQQQQQLMTTASSFPLPVSWFKTQWLELFLEQLDVSQLTREELQTYRRCALRIIELGPAQQRPAGVHSSDWERFIRDYLIFVALNSEHTVLPTGFTSNSSDDNSNNHDGSFFSEEEEDAEAGDGKNNSNKNHNRHDESSVVSGFDMTMNRDHHDNNNNINNNDSYNSEDDDEYDDHGPSATKNSILLL